MFRKLAAGLAVIALLISTVTLVSYLGWRSDKLEELRSDSQIADTSVGKIEYVLEGTEGPVLLFLHGTPGGYDQAPEDFQGFRLLAPSRPGYLATPIEVGRTPAEQSEAHLALLDALDIQEVIVMGVSGGGPSALAFAASHPKRVRALVAMEAVSQRLEPVDMPGFMDSDFLFWFLFNAFEFGAGFEAILEVVVPDPEIRTVILDDAVMQGKIKAVLWSGWPPSLRREGLRNDMMQFSKLDLPLSEISVPTLIIHGTADINVPFSHAELIAEKVPGARLHTIEGADHMMPFTHALEVRTALNRFVAELDD